MKKQLCYLFMVFSLVACEQGSKERTIAENDKIQKITVPKKTTIMDDTLNPYLFIPTNYVSDTTIIDKNYYVAVRTGNSQLDFRVGDVPVSLNLFFGEITYKDGRKTGAYVPINSCILKSGKYKVTGKIIPRYGEKILEFHSYLMMGGYYIKSGDWDNEYPMFTIETSDNYHKEGKIYNPITGYPYFVLETEIEVDVPYEVEGWSRSVNLKEQKEEELKKELQQSYDEIRQIIAKKDIAAFRSLIEEREDLLKIVYYLPSAEKERRIADLLAVIMNDDFDIAPYPQEAQLLYFAEGKMVTLVDPINRKGVVRLVNKKDPENIISLDFRFHRKRKGDKLTVI